MTSIRRHSQCGGEISNSEESTRPEDHIKDKSQKRKEQLRDAQRKHRERRREATDDLVLRISDLEGQLRSCEQDKARFYDLARHLVTHIGQQNNCFNCRQMKQNTNPIMDASGQWGLTPVNDYHSDSTLFTNNSTIVPTTATTYESQSPTVERQRQLYGCGAEAVDRFGLTNTTTNSTTNTTTNTTLEPVEEYSRHIRMLGSQATSEQLLQSFFPDVSSRGNEL